MRVDPVSGDRRRISGGRLCVVTVGNDECTSPVGARGAGPDFLNPLAIAVESPRAYVVVDRSRVMRVNRRTGRRTVLAEIQSPAASDGRAAAEERFRERVRWLSAEDPRRLYRPSHPRAWLRDALGDAAGTLRTDRPEQLFSRLSPAQTRTLSQRLYAALWKTMRDVLGSDDPDTVEAARAGAPHN